MPAGSLREPRGRERRRRQDRQKGEGEKAHALDTPAGPLEVRIATTAGVAAGNRNAMGAGGIGPLASCSPRDQQLPLA
jgi:hypothetical protein